MSSQLAPALAATLGHEGGWVNDKQDPGGETYAGITRRDHPQWPGWPIIDAAKARTGFPGNLAQQTELPQLVAQVYRAGYWSALMGDSIPDQDVANEVFDSAVNAGPSRAIAWLQEALQALSRPDWPIVIPDGRMGMKTLDALAHALNAGDKAALLLLLNVRQGDHYYRLASSKPSMRKFLRGWLRRVELRRRPAGHVA